MHFPSLYEHWYLFLGSLSQVLSHAFRGRALQLEKLGKS